MNSYLLQIETFDLDGWGGFIRPRKLAKFTRLRKPMKVTRFKVFLQDYERNKSLPGMESSGS